MKLIERLCRRQIENATAEAVRAYTEEATRLRADHMEDLRTIYALRQELEGWQRQAVQIEARTASRAAKERILKDAMRRVDSIGVWEDGR